MPLPLRSLRTALLACLAALAWAAEPGATEDSLRARWTASTGAARLAAQLDLANHLENLRPSEALKLALDGAAQAGKAGDKAKEAAFLSSAAFSCTSTGDLADSVAYGKRALALGTELGDRDRMARAHNTLGIAYAFMGTYSQALEEGREALRLRESMGNEKAVDQSLNLIGLIYHRSGQYDKAIEYYRQILDRASAGQEPRRIILARHNLGFALFKLGRLEEALQHHQQALDLAMRSRETSLLAYAHMNLGMVQAELGNFKVAQESLERALAGYRKTEQKHGEAQVVRSLARLELLEGDPERGIPMAKLGIDLARRINAREELKECYELLSAMYEKQGRLAEAFQAFKAAAETKDAITSVAESARIAEAAMRIVTLKKDNEIESLRKEQTISALKLEKQRYSVILLVATTVFLVTGVTVLGLFNRRMREHRKSLQSTNADLARMNAELQDRMTEIKTLSGLLPICAHCKKIRDDAGYWNQLEGYISERTTATFSHGVCPHCAEQHYPEAMADMKAASGGPAPADSGA